MHLKHERQFFSVLLHTNLCNNYLSYMIFFFFAILVFVFFHQFFGVDVLINCKSLISSHFDFCDPHSNFSYNENIMSYMGCDTTIF